MPALESKCPTEDALIAFSSGDSGPDKGRQIVQHLDRCTSCRQVVAAVARGLHSRSQSISQSQAATVPVPLPGLPLPSRDLVRGDLVGRYTIASKLGQGAMGAVYAAHDPALDRTVAIKVLHSHFDGHQEQQTRLVREAKALAKINHPNVVVVHDVGFTNSSVFLAMENVRGGTLRTWIKTKRPWRDVVNIFISAGQGLIAAHGVGVIHRDFKPENVLVDDAQRPRVSDFGLAREATTQAHGDVSSATSDFAVVSQTQSGVMIGTPAYMAAEQFAGEVSDAKTDQFAFCVSLFELLTGQRPFQGKTLTDLSTAVAGGQHRWPPASPVPAAIKKAISRGLSPHGSDRYAAMEPLLAALRQALRRRSQLKVGAIAAVFAAGLTTVVAATSRGAQVNPCENGDGAIEATWGDEHRTAVITAFQTYNASFVADTTSKAVAAMDNYVARWSVHHNAVCKATRIDKSQTEAHMTARMNCLQAAQLDIAATVKLWQQPDIETIGHAIDAVYALPSLPLCASIDPASGSYAPVPASIADVVALWNQDAAAAQALLTTGKMKQAAELTNALVARAREMKHAPALVKALLLSVDSSTEERQALATAQEAILVADAAGDDVQRVIAMVEVVAWAYLLPKPEAEQTLARAQAAVRRHMVSDHEKAELDLHRAELLARWGQRADAIAILRSTLQQRGGPQADDQIAGSIAIALAQQLALSANRPEALLLMSQRLAITKRTHGHEHPLVGRILAWISLQQNADEAAHQSALQSYNILQQAYGPQSPAVAVALDALSAIALSALRSKDAENYARQSISIAKLGDDHQQNAQSQLRLWAALQAQGRLAEGLVVITEGLNLIERWVPDQLPALIAILTAQALASMDVEDFPNATKYAQRAVDISDRLPSDAIEKCAAWFISGAVANAKEDLSSAERWFRTTLSHKQCVADNQLPIKSNLALTLWATGKRKEATLLLTQAYAECSGDCTEEREELRSLMKEWRIAIPAL